MKNINMSNNINIFSDINIINFLFGPLKEEASVNTLSYNLFELRNSTAIYVDGIIITD